MFFSKTLTLSRPAILESITSKVNTQKHSVSSGSLEFFYLGFPPTAPITPEGSILVTLNSEFLSYNQDSFAWGSVGDSGGIKLGYSKFVSPELSTKTRLSYGSFIEIIKVVSELPSLDQSNLLSKVPTLKFIEKSEPHLHSAVTLSLKHSDLQTDWSIEFCMKSDFTIHKEHIREIRIPNTYRNTTYIRSINAEFTNKIRFYNPKFSVLR